MSFAVQEVTLCGKPLTTSRHACAFFYSPEEEYSVMLPFYKQGLEQGEKAVHIVNEALKDDHRARLAAGGIDVAQAERSGQLSLCNWEEAYLRGGRFDKLAMLAFVEDTLKSIRAQGYPQARLMGHMEWALKEMPGVRDLVEYETRLNYVLPNYDDPVVCVYDLTRFDASVVVDILRTHPMVVIGGTLQENPFYIPPAQFLEELASREKLAQRN